ncbi:DUF488 family protein, partial [Myxococcota bacterium]|nr:DUF488 family protein [Myxococcota bacterium]
SPRAKDEGTRIGTVRRPPRGVPKSKWAALDYYDVWFPTLAPSLPTMKIALASETDRDWKRFETKYRAEMREPESRHALALLARLSHDADFSLGCYCEEESRCHRSILRRLLQAEGARITPA